MTVGEPESASLGFLDSCMMFRTIAAAFFILLLMYVMSIFRNLVGT